jgi:hypothetical protein
MQTLIFQASTKTIRQMPQNYLIAHNESGRWICDPDLAADKKLCAKIFLALFEFKNKYGTGENLLTSIL